MPAPVVMPPRIRLAQLPTPLQPLNRLTAELRGPRLWVKRDDLTGSALSGNKVRKLEFSLAQAREENCGVVITCGGIQSNHCRATAVAGAMLGMKVHLILRGLPGDGPPEGNLFLDHLFGAQVSLYTAEEYTKNAGGHFDEWKAHYEAQEHKAFCIPTGASDEIGLWGYIAAAEELAGQARALGLDLRHVVHATGSGGTAAGLAAGAALLGMGARMQSINICDDAPTFEAKIREDLRRWRVRYGPALDVEALPINIIDGYAGPGYAQATPEIFQTIAHVARTEGIALDPVYSGKAFHGLMEEIRAGRFGTQGDLVFVHTGGLFGSFAFRPQFQQHGTLAPPQFPTN